MGKHAYLSPRSKHGTSNQQGMRRKEPTSNWNPGDISYGMRWRRRSHGNIWLSWRLWWSICVQCKRKLGTARSCLSRIPQMQFQGNLHCVRQSVLLQELGSEDHAHVRTMCKVGTSM